MKKLILLVCMALIPRLALNAEESDPVLVQGIQLADETAATTEGSRAPFYLDDGLFRYKIETISGAAGTFWGTCIDEEDCVGGDIRALFTLHGEFAISVFNMGRYDNRCGWISKGPLNLPPPLYMSWMNEIGTGSGPLTLVWDSADAWFHESVNDSQVQGWVPGPGWQVNTAWDPSPTYDMVGTGSAAWSITYYSSTTYPMPGDFGFQFEACFRKIAGEPGATMGVYFNGDGTMDNCVVVGIDTQGAYIVFEYSGGLLNVLTGWNYDEAHLFADDSFIAGENVWNMIKVNVYFGGTFDVFLNENQVVSLETDNNLSGYVGLAVYDDSSDHVSCDNMTLSTRPRFFKNLNRTDIKKSSDTGVINVTSSR